MAGKTTGHFDVGEVVMARWPGSKLWYEAVVLSTNYEEDQFQLRFPDGQENEVPHSHLMKKARFRFRSSSPSRRRKSSPGRRRSRSKSPSRKKAASPKSPRGRGRPKRVTSQQAAAAKDLDEKPPKPETVTVTTKTNISKTPPRTAVAQQLQARVTRSALKQLEKQGVDTHAIRKSLGEGLEEKKPPPSKPHRTAFGGPVGALFVMLSLPLVVFSTYFYCNDKKCYKIYEIFNSTKIKLPPAKEFFDPQAAAMIYGWVAFQAFLSLLPLGKVVEGLPLQDKTKLKYRLNGFSAFLISLASFAACIYYKLPVAKMINEKFLGLITHALILAFILSVFLFVKSYVQQTGISPLGNTGNPIYDFFMGRQLNPRIGGFDIKFFCELRPGLIGLVIIDLAMLIDSYQRSNGSINAALLLLCSFQCLYIVDALWFEGAILSTPDINYEGFGFMLAFGDLVWVPFIFSIQARFLAQHPYVMSLWCGVLVFLFHSLGFVIYRVANLQKDLFRQNPSHPAVQHLESMPTLVPGSRLLISGWWGYVRHPNYLGDIMMGVAWSLTCGFTHGIPYLYPVYLTTLLVYRSYRFEALCREKYGLTWEEYCKRVRYRIFPNIF